MEATERARKRMQGLLEFTESLCHNGGWKGGSIRWHETKKYIREDCRV